MNINSLAAKLKALAERGEPGERELAQQKLDDLLKKYNLSESSIEDDTAVDYHDVRYQQAWEKSLLLQVGYKVLNHTDSYSRTKGKNHHKLKVVVFLCTKSQALEIEYLFSFYKELFQRELNFFMNAFVQKHRLFGDATDEKQEIDDEEIAKLIKMCALMEDAAPHKALEVKA